MFTLGRRGASFDKPKLKRLDNAIVRPVSTNLFHSRLGITIRD